MALNVSVAEHNLTVHTTPPPPPAPTLEKTSLIIFPRFNKISSSSNYAVIQKAALYCSVQAIVAGLLLSLGQYLSGSSTAAFSSKHIYAGHKNSLGYTDVENKIDFTFESSWLYSTYFLIFMGTPLLKIVKFFDIVKLITSVFMYKFHRKLLPSIFSNVLHPC